VGYTKITKKEIKIRDVEVVKLEIEDAIGATGKIILELEKRALEGKIVLLKLYGILKQGKHTDIKFQEIQDYVEKIGAYSFLKNTSKLVLEKQDLTIDFESSEKEEIEERLIKNYAKDNPSNLNELILPLMEALSLEKQEDEKSMVFESRLFSSLGKVLDVDLDEEV